MKHEIEVIIYRNKTTVFEHLTDPAKIKMWDNHFISATPVTDLAKGGIYQQTVQLMLGNKELKGEVIEFEKNKSFSYFLFTPNSKITASYCISPYDGETSTKLVATGDIIPVSNIAKLLSSPLAWLSTRKKESNLRRLKIFLDQGGDKR